MSIIVGVRKHDKTVIASDGLSTLGSMKIHADNNMNGSKLVRLENCVLGVAGWTAIQDILEHLAAKKPELFEFSGKEELFDKSLQIHRELVDTYFINTSEDNDQPVDSSQMHFLVATKDSLFEVESYRAVVEYKKFFAIGSGARFALGAMQALYDRLDSPEEIAEAAVESACYFSDSCGLPNFMETLA